MSSDARGTLPPLKQIFTQHSLLILAVVALTTGAAWWYTSHQERTYTAEAVVLLSPAPGNPLTPETASGSSVQMTIALETEAQLARTPAVAAVASQAAGRPLPAEGEILQASVPSNTQMLRLSFTAATPEDAQAGADAFAEGYLAYRQERSTTQRDSRIERLSDQVEEVEGNLQRARGEEAGDLTTQEAQLFADQLAGLNSALGEAQAQSVYPGAVVNAAEPPAGPNEPPAVLLIALAALLGVAAGTGLGFAREWHRDLIRTETDLPDLPIFATLRLDPGRALAPDSDPRLHEEYRHVRTGILANCPTPQVLAVAELPAPDGDSGESAIVATNLAVVLGEAGFEVLLLATASQEPGVRDLLQPPPEAGRYTGDPAEGWHEAVPTQGVRLLTVAELSSPDLTASREFQRLLTGALPEVDYVVVATAAAGTADGDAALTAAHSTLLLLRPGTVSRRQARAALTRLERLGVRVVGGVLCHRRDRTPPRSPAPARRAVRDHARS